MNNIYELLNKTKKNSIVNEKEKLVKRTRDIGKTTLILLMSLTMAVSVAACTPQKQNNNDINETNFSKQ